MAQMRFTESAEQDLVDMGDFHCTDNPANAAKFTGRLESHCRLLAAHPMLRRASDELAEALRSSLMGGAWFYRALTGGLGLMRVPHGGTIGCPVRDE